MPQLYLITIKNMTCNDDEKNYAIISKEKQDKLDKLEQGEFTGIFNDFGLHKDIVKNLQTIVFEKNIFEEILENYHNSKKIKITNENNIIYCVIDNKKIIIKSYPSEKIYLEYNDVGIYN